MQHSPDGVQVAEQLGDDMHVLQGCQPIHSQGILYGHGHVPIHTHVLYPSMHPRTVQALGECAVACQIQLFWLGLQLVVRQRLSHISGHVAPQVHGKDTIPKP